jgi:hypothetical protein
MLMIMLSQEGSQFAFRLRTLPGNDEESGDTAFKKYK